MRFLVSRESTGWRADPQVEGAQQRDDSRWVVDLVDLEALLRVVEEAGRHVLLDGADPAIGLDLPSITIYDDYIE